VKREIAPEGGWALGLNARFSNNEFPPFWDDRYSLTDCPLAAVLVDGSVYEKSAIGEAVSSSTTKD
jgi:hypothetical protein